MGEEQSIEKAWINATAQGWAKEGYTESRRSEWGAPWVWSSGTNAAVNESGKGIPRKWHKRKRRGWRFRRAWKKPHWGHPGTPGYRSLPQTLTPALPKPGHHTFSDAAGAKDRKDDESATAAPHGWSKTGPAFSSDAAGDGPGSGREDADSDEDNASQMSEAAVADAFDAATPTDGRTMRLVTHARRLITCRVTGCTWHTEAKTEHSVGMLLGQHLRRVSAPGHNSARSIETHFGSANPFGRCPKCGHLYARGAGVTQHAKKCTTHPIDGWTPHHGFMLSGAGAGPNGLQALAGGAESHSVNARRVEQPSEGTDAAGSVDEIGGRTWRDVYTQGSQRPVTTVHSRLRAAFRGATLALVRAISAALHNNDADTAETTTLALYALPALALNARGRHRTVPECKGDFVAVGESVDPLTTATQLLERHQCRLEQMVLPPRPSDQEAEQTAEVKRQKALHRAEELAAAGQLGRALRVLESYRGPAPLSRHEYRKQETVDALQHLHPAASARDELPVYDPSLDGGPPRRLQPFHVSEALRVSARKSSGGMSHWTLDLLKVIADETLEIQITELFNLLLAGKGGRPEVWTLSRLVPIPKPGNNGIRPIAVGEVWLRLLGRAVSLVCGKDIGWDMAPLQYGVGIPCGADIIVHTFQAVTRVIEAHEAGTYIGAYADADPWVIVSIDCSNAFNEICRSCIYFAIRKHCPELLAYFGWAYGSATPLLFNDGFQACSSGTGVRQGDPLGPLFFSLGLQPVLEEVSARFKPAGVTIMAYMDDINLAGPRSQCLAAFALLKAKLAHIGLRVNTQKTVMFDASLRSAQPEEAFSPSAGLVVRTDGIKLLGNPCGGAFEAHMHAEDSWLARKVEKATDVLSLLPDLPAAIALSIGRACVNARMSYLTRTMSPDATAAAAQQFDSKMDGLLTALTGWQGALPEVAVTLRQLPLDMGGIGMASLFNTREVAYAASWGAAATYITRHNNPLWRTLVDSGLYTRETALLKKAVPGFMGLTRAGLDIKEQAPELAEWGEDPGGAEPSESEQGRGISDKGKVRAKQATARRMQAPGVPMVSRDGIGAYFSTIRANGVYLQASDLPPDDSEARLAPGAEHRHRLQSGKLMQRAHLTNRGNLLKKDLQGHSSTCAWIISGSDKRSSAWIYTAALQRDDGSRRLADRDFREALRLRLGMGLHNGLQGTTFKCDCHHQRSLIPGRDEHHALSCPKRGESQTRLRHDLVVTAAATFFRTIVGAAGQILVEPPPAASGVRRTWKPDITVIVGPVRYHIDVSIINPASRTYYLNCCPGSDSIPDVANKARERVKIASARTALGAHVADRCGVPFVVEATGRLGPAARALLDRTLDDSRRYGVGRVSDRRASQALKRLEQEILYILLSANGAMQRAGRRTSRLFQTREPQSDGPPERAEWDTLGPHQQATTWAPSAAAADAVAAPAPPSPEPAPTEPSTLPALPAPPALLPLPTTADPSTAWTLEESETVSSPPQVPWSEVANLFIFQATNDITDLPGRDQGWHVDTGAMNPRSRSCDCKNHWSCLTVGSAGDSAREDDSPLLLCSLSVDRVECTPSTCSRHSCYNRPSQDPHGGAWVAVVRRGPTEQDDLGLVLCRGLGHHGYIGEFTGRMRSYTDYARLVEQPSVAAGDLTTHVMEMAREKAGLVNRADPDQVDRIVIDASTHGNLTRFIRHSCTPNCHAEHWLVDGKPKMLLFSSLCLDAGTELTLDLGLLWSPGRIPRPCECGSPSCRGFQTRYVPDNAELDALDATRRRIARSTGPSVAHLPAAPPVFTIETYEDLQALVEGKRVSLDQALQQINHIRVFTDGSSRPTVSKPDSFKAGWGFCVTEHLAGRREAEDRVLAELFGPVLTQYLPRADGRNTRGEENPLWIGATTEDNNTAELCAIVESLLFLQSFDPLPLKAPSPEQQPLVGGHISPPNPCPLVVIASDSEVGINSIARGATASHPQFRKLVGEARNLIAKLHAERRAFVLFAHVPGHAGIPGNVRADLLADYGRQGQCKTGRFSEMGNIKPGVIIETGFPTPARPKNTRAHARRLLGKPRGPAALTLFSNSSSI